MVTDEDVAGWMKQGSALPMVGPNLTYGLEPLTSRAELCSSCSAGAADAVVGVKRRSLALGGEFEDVLSLHTISLVFPHLKHFVLVTQGWGLRKDLLVDGC